MFEIKLKGDPRFFHIETDDVTVFAKLRKAFSVKDEKAKMLKNKKNAPASARFMPDRKYAITPGGRFEAGMLEAILSTLGDISDDTLKSVKFGPGVMSIYKPSFKHVPVYDDFPVHSLREYQVKAMELAHKQGRGIILLGTGGGKSLLMASLISAYLKENPDDKVLLVVSTVPLLTQIFMDFSEYQVPFTFTRWNGTYDRDPNASVTIATQDIILSRIDSSDWVYESDFLVCDECHTISPSSMITDILAKVKTPHKFGLTGTLNPDEFLKWRSIGFFGPVLFKMRSKELRDKKFLSEASVISYKIKHKGIAHDEFNYADECEYISNCGKRNKAIAEVLEIINGNCLILVNYIAHGENLKRILSEMYPDREVVFISGETPDDEREAIRQKMEKVDNIICVASIAIFSTGINITNLPYIILAMGGKAYIRLVQSIGRGLRLHRNKKKLYIFDFYDDLQYSFTHYNSRSSIYDDEDIKVIEMEPIVLT